MRDDLTIDVFLERVRQMPDEEAEIELVLRMEHHHLQYAVCMRARQELAGRSEKDKKREFARLGQEVAAMSHDFGRLRDELKMIRRRMDRLNWSKAVRDVLGEEAYEQCRVWMAANCTLPGKRTGDDIEKFKPTWSNV